LQPETADTAPAFRRVQYSRSAGRKRMSRKQESLRDLIENRAALYCIAPRALCRWALEAIVQNTLPLVLPEDVSLDTADGVGRTLRSRIVGLLPGIESVDFFKFGWVRNLKCDPKEFDRWLNVETKAASSPGISRLPRQKRPPDAVVRRVVQKYVNWEQSTGRSTAIPRMWDHVKKELRGATYQQAVKALRAIEGGPKQRGRPRRGTPVRK
jgi:hypothetical protein